MNRSRVGAIVLRILYLYRGSPQRVFPIFIWVAVDILLWGFLTRYLNSVSQGPVNFVPALLGAVLLWDFLTRVMQGVTMAFFEDVWSRNFLNLFATPLRISEYLAGLVIAAIGVERAQPRRHGRVRPGRVRPVVSDLWDRARALRRRAVPDRHRDGRRRRPGSCCASGRASEWLDLADPDDRFAVRRGLLSGRGPAGLDAGDRGGRCRRPTCSRACGRSSPASRRPGARWPSGRRSPSLSRARLPVLRVRLQESRSAPASSPATAPNW